MRAKTPGIHHNINAKEANSETNKMGDPIKRVNARYSSTVSKGLPLEVIALVYIYTRQPWR